MNVDGPLGGILDSLVRFESRLAAMAGPLARLVDRPRATDAPSGHRRRPVRLSAAAAAEMTITAASPRRREPALTR